MAYSSETVANTFLKLAQESGRTITNLKMQSLVYIAHGYTLAIIDRPLINDEIKAWNFGPVIPDLYEKLRRYGREHIQEQIPNNTPIDDIVPEKRIIALVWEKYKDHSAGQLSALTRLAGAPWDQVWRKSEFAVIPNSITKDYYATFKPKELLK